MPKSEEATAVLQFADQFVAALHDCLITDGQYSGNLTDLVGNLAISLNRIGNAITPAAAAPSQDAAGAHVGSLTEAVMGMTGGLMSIAGAIEDLAEAIRERNI